MAMAIGTFTGLFILGIGLLILFFAFWNLKKFLKIKNTTHSKINSLSNGLVEINGTVVSEKTIKSPFSQSECVYYKYDIQEYTLLNSRRTWKSVAMGHRSVPFFLKDETGFAYINPEKAEFYVNPKKVFSEHAGMFNSPISLTKSLKKYDSGKADFNPDQLKLEPVDEDSEINFNGMLQSYMARLGDRMTRLGDHKYYEYYIKPDEVVYILGTASKEPSLKSNILIQRGKNDKTFIISTDSTNELLSLLILKMIIYFGIGGFLAVFSIVETLLQL